MGNRGMGRLGRGIAAALVLLVWCGGAAAQAEPPGEPAPGELGLSIGIASIRGLGGLDLGEAFQGYARTGATWVRVDLDWSVVQAAGPDSYDWSAMDSHVALARGAGLRLLPVVSFSPRWLDGGAAPATPAAVEAYARFLGAAVARYRPLGIRAWEIWNEPNLSGFWAPAPDPVAYARLLAAAHAAVKAADPGALVISGGLSPAPGTGPDGGPIAHFGATAFLESVYANGAAGTFDALCFHPYSWPRMPDTLIPWSGWSMMAGPIRDLMVAHGDGAKRIWMTEYGAPTAAGGVDEAGQAEMLRRAVGLARGEAWAGPLFWYSFRDLGTDPGESEDWYGLLRHDGTPKPALATFRELAAPGGN